MTHAELHTHPQGGWCVAYPTGEGNIRHFTPPSTKRQAQALLGQMQATPADKEYWSTIERPEENKLSCQMAIDRPGVDNAELRYENRHTSNPILLGKD